MTRVVLCHQQQGVMCEDGGAAPICLTEKRRDNVKQQLVKGKVTLERLTGRHQAID